MVKGSVADSCGMLAHGDQILAVNGEDLKTASQEKGALTLKVLIITLLYLLMTFIVLVITFSNRSESFF